VGDDRNPGDGPVQHSSRCLQAGDPETAAAIRAFVVDNFLLGDDEGLDDDVSLLESGIVDSTGVVEIVTYLEERFGIEVLDEELVRDNLDSISRLARFVERKTPAGAISRDSSEA
jgi:acyl carrier protein